MGIKAFDKKAERLLTSLCESIRDAIAFGNTEAGASVEFPDGCWIEASTDSQDNVRVEVFHMKEDGGECQNIQNYIEGQIPEWYDMEKEDEGYIPGLDPGFGSWQDYYNYKYG